jgi:hypothetical protein
LSWPTHRHADDGPVYCYCLLLPSSAISEPATAIAKRRALGMFPPAETTRAVPATEIITPWMSSAVTALAAVASALGDGCLGSHGAFPATAECVAAGLAGYTSTTPLLPTGGITPHG